MGSRIWFPHDRTPRDKSGQKKIPKSFRTTFSVLEHHFPVLEHPFLLCPVLSRVPSRILAVPARPVPNFGCPGPSHPLARFLACPVVPLSRDNEGTFVPVSRKVALSRPVGNPTFKHKNTACFKHVLIIMFILINFRPSYGLTRSNEEMSEERERPE